MSATPPPAGPDFRSPGLSRRRLVAGASGVAVGVWLAGRARPAWASTVPPSLAAGDTRKVTSDAGLVEVPANPQRVVCAIGGFETDVVAVGVMPVMATTFAGPWVTFDDTVVISENIPPTAEQLALVDPDVMIGWTWITEEAGFDQLATLAPYVGLGETVETVGPQYAENTQYNSWDLLFRSVADVVNKRAEADALVAEFDARLEALRTRRDGEPDVRIARVQFYEPGTFSYRGLNEDAAELMRRVGLTPVGPEQSINAASMETLPEIDADVIVVPVGGGMPAELFDEVSESALWKSIPAVQAGNVVVVDGRLWPGLGYLWAQALTDDLERLFFTP